MAFLLAVLVLASSVVAQRPADTADKVVTGTALRHGVAAPTHLSWWGGDSASLTNTEPDADGKRSIAATIKEAINTQLHGSKQWVNALIASAIGILLIADGDLVFKWVVLAAIFLLSMILASNEVGAGWGLPHGNHVRLFVSFEVGLGAAFAAWTGIQGVMLAVGGLVGAAAAHGFKHVLVHVYPQFEEMRLLIVLWYSFFVVGIAAMINQRKHLGVLAIVAPFIGGALISSAVCWWITAKAAEGKMHWVYSQFPHLSRPVGGAWVDFLSLLVSSNAADVGIFANGAYDQNISGDVWRMDRILGIALWTIFAVIGMVFQVKRIKKSKLAVASSSPAMHGLGEPLMK